VYKPPNLVQTDRRCLIANMLDNLIAEVDRCDNEQLSERIGADEQTTDGDIKSVKQWVIGELRLLKMKLQL
jgi:hypothetical protein